MPPNRKRARQKSGPRQTTITGGDSQTSFVAKPRLVTPTKVADSQDTDDNTPNTVKRRIFGKWMSVPSIPAVVNQIYRDNQRHTLRLGDSSSDDPMNGEFTVGSTQRLIQKMVEFTELRDDRDAIFVDIGSGSGKIVMHVAACLPHIRSVGIEVSKIRYIVSILCLKDALERKDEYGGRVLFKYADLLQLGSLGPLTHVYAASAAFPDNVMQHLAHLWNRSEAAKYLVCNHNPRQVIDDFGFAVSDLNVKVSCSMHGSGEGKTFFFYQRLERCNADEIVAVDGGEMLAPQQPLLSEEELASLDNASRDERLQAIKETLNDFMNEPTAKRARKVKRYSA